MKQFVFYLGVLPQGGLKIPQLTFYHYCNLKHSSGKYRPIFTKHDFKQSPEIEIIFIILLANDYLQGLLEIKDRLQYSWELLKVN